jgi:hypothetical protein
MSTRSDTAPTGNFVPVSIVITLIALVAMLFVVLQTANLPIFPAGNSATYGAAKAPLFRGLVHIPLFRFMPPLFGSAAPEVAEDESRMPVDQRIDRWQPFIKEASARYSIPEKWIRTIIQIESGGRTMLVGRPITSGAGAMGVMQLMRDTYNEMSERNGLGSDPYNVRDNILAGTAYLRELYNQYGYPRLFAAYNAGPGTLEAHMHGATLPAETRNYVRLALAGTTTADVAAKLLAPFLPKPRVVKASTSKVTKTVATKSSAKSVKVAEAETATKATHVAGHGSATKAAHVAAVHSAAKSVHVARAAHTSAKHRVKAAA